MKSRMPSMFWLLFTFTVFSFLGSALLPVSSTSASARLESTLTPGTPPDDTPTLTPSATPTPTSTPTPKFGVNQMGLDTSGSQHLLFLTTTPEAGMFELTVRSTMGVNDSQLVELRLRPGAVATRTPSAASTGTDTTVPLSSGAINLYPRMSVELIGSNFDISTATKKEQVLIDGQETTWTWTISPTTKGSHSLDVVVSVPVQVVGHQEIFSSTIRTEPVVVDVAEDDLDKLARWVAAISGVLGLPVALFAIGKAYWDLRQAKKDVVGAFDRGARHAGSLGGEEGAPASNGLEEVRKELKGRWRL